MYAPIGGNIGSPGEGRGGEGRRYRTERHTSSSAQAGAAMGKASHCEGTPFVTHAVRPGGCNGRGLREAGKPFSSSDIGIPLHFADLSARPRKRPPVPDTWEESAPAPDAEKTACHEVNKGSSPFESSVSFQNCDFVERYLPNRGSEVRGGSR